jgi:uncharacterized protein
MNLETNEAATLNAAIKQSWAKIAPFWPLKNLIAVNPLAGFEHLPFEEALRQGVAYFQQDDLPEEMQKVNRHTIKWLQVYFDQGQATIKMPFREQGLYKSVKALIFYDIEIYPRNKVLRSWFQLLPDNPDAVIATSLQFLKIPTAQHAEFLTLMLTTLPGWAAHVQYRTSWADAADERHPNQVSQSEYLALRLLLTCLTWHQAENLLTWHAEALRNANVDQLISQIEKGELTYHRELLEAFATPQPDDTITEVAQLVFCIDVRSEPFRRALEAQDHYETFGFAGFFGLPVSITNTITSESYASCPVLLKPVCEVKLKPTGLDVECEESYARQRGIKRLYQSLKYTFSTPFALVEAMGAWSGLWMAGQTLIPKAFGKLTQAANPVFDFKPELNGLSFDRQCAFAAGALGAMGLTKKFASLVVFCGHGSETSNNAFGTALDCGACGGHHGAPNARLLALILNQGPVRTALINEGIYIPETTYFIAGEHNTTTDHVELYTLDLPHTHVSNLKSLKADLKKARVINSHSRAIEMGEQRTPYGADAHVLERASDWAQVRPEWGLARNAAFIIGPRKLTKNANLKGRSFLHSYDWTQDTDGENLTGIMTAPMVVAQWINAQYLFSTLDNVAYGAGSKVTQNITGKIGIMQGNASDLMHGLPLQSVNQTDTEAYHEPLRLTCVVYAPVGVLNSVINSQAILQKLFSNGWVMLICFDPITQQTLKLDRDMTWQLYQKQELKTYSQPVEVN